MIFAYTYLPGVDEIGGDFYDVFKTSDGSVSILIGDVSGKGIPAAALASDTRSAVRAFAFDCSCAGEALERANSALSAQDIEIGMFVTIFIAILNPDTGRLKYACAGQPPPIIYHSASRELEFLRVGDLPLCIYKDSTYKEYEADLSPNIKLSCTPTVFRKPTRKALCLE